MRIVQLLPALNEGGVERGAVELNREFARRGHSSVVMSAGGRLVEQIERDGGRHVTLDLKSKNPLTAPARAARVRRALADLGPDMVHYRSRAPGWLFWIANQRLRLPFVSTVHGFNSVNLYSRVMTFGQRVIVPGTAVAAHIREHYRTPEARIRLIYRGLDPEVFDPARLDLGFMEAFKRQHGLKGRFVALSVGRLTPLKGVDALLRATALARARVPEILAVIVGGAQPGREAYAEQLRRLAAELRIAEHVVFVGHQSRLAEIYACGHALVSANPSKPEAFGRSMAEALALNCPVIATRGGGALDIVREGFNGWLVNPNDPAELADRLEQASRTRFHGLREDALARFSLEQMVEKTLAVYQEVLAERVSP